MHGNTVRGCTNYALYVAINGSGAYTASGVVVGDNIISQSSITSFGFYTNCKDMLIFGNAPASPSSTTR